ncbi:trans-aconitate 2-methyltransferase [Mycobacterium sp. CVI_P3]|uniref:Trans-aconitate 2-methyltransferase n=1 Tax=Mycobacterium pinniadriaticum TaxID=2994102 RepID=A0ABT3SIK1_9MYCO|nr:trans-aconitate 2-methyltransferase [Mycobacterium pinniadriaticum]MCX2932607.1 trans-aconitate 2-methyltransferase [Mycobacterium pinniadriaticum]MCX2938949.1 trans-aconitate 2-methyltransferase [Mycobacterium pinniadriaticum]
MWNPQTYLAFADQRGRPFFDLLARIGARSPRRVVDLGCGPGNLTEQLAQHWPDAALEAVDSSPEMVAAARERGIDAELGDISAWTPRSDTDVVFSNAALQWIPGHGELMVRWAGLLEPGGWIAVQVPGNFDAPSHVAIRSLADQAHWSKVLGDFAFRNVDAVETPIRYAELLTGAGCTVDAWETTYIHELTGPDPVLNWISGTALTPLRDRLTDDQWQQFRAELIPLLNQAYPVRPDGRTYFPFRRIFFVAQVGPR